MEEGERPLFLGDPGSDPDVAAPAEPRGGALVLALGDSLTAGYGLPPAQSFASQLERLLRRHDPGAKVVNAGISGDTSAGGRARLARTIARLDRSPDLAIVQLGANDIIRGVDPATTHANLDAILTDCAGRGIPVLLTGMVAPAFLGAFASRFNAIFPDLAKAHGVPLYPFFLEGVAARPGLTLRDGIHPNARAIGIVAERILPHVEATMADAIHRHRAADPLHRHDRPGG